MKRQRIPRGPRQRGLALIEVLVAVIILAFGILGVVGLQASMTRAQTSSTFRAEASFLAQHLIGDMWTDRANLAGYDTGICEAACKDFLRRVAAQLPHGESTIKVNTVDGVTTVDIEIRWRLPGEDESRFTTSTAITNS